MAFLPFTRPTIDEESIRDIAEVLRGGWIASGPYVLEFEAALSAYLGRRAVRVMTSATQALEIALRVAGIGPGDEVIVPAMSFVATANVVARVGAKPVFVDVDLHTRNFLLEDAEHAITSATRAILPVHFAGLPVDMDRVHALAGAHRLRVIEDAAHAIGSSLNGRRIGSFGDLVCFSFHPNKNMTTIEGGAIVASDPSEITAIERHRFHGIDRQGDDMDVLFPGGKANMPDVSARLGIAQLARLDEFNERRRKLASLYCERLAALPGLHLPERGDAGHSWHMFVARLDLAHLTLTRQELIERMRERGIGIGIHYPAMHLFTCYRAMGYRSGQFPNAERIGWETITLPLFPAMSEDDVLRVCDTLGVILEDHRR